MLSGVGESAQVRLLKSPYFALREICCAYQDGIVTLRGILPSYYLKQLAQALVGDVEGVTAIVNEIEVASALEREAPGGPAGAVIQAVISRKVQIENRHGLHLRAAEKFVRTARQYQCQIRVTCGDQVVDGKSILGLATLAAEEGTWLLLEAEGPDAQELITALCDLIGDRFGENESVS